MTIRKSMGRALKKIAQQQKDTRPTTAIVHSVDMNYVNLRLEQSGSILRHVEVMGDAAELRPGQEVSITWVEREGSPGEVPVVSISKMVGGDLLAEASVPVDNVTIYQSDYGLSVKHGGITFAHLNFVPALDGHTHEDSLTANGWQVTDDGIIYSNYTAIHPSGQISLGINNDIIKLDSQHATYRLWAGNVDPAAASFSVSKAGAVKATLGTIAGWTIDSQRIYKTNAVLHSDGYVSFGATPPAAYGSNVGAYLGYTGGAAKMSLYASATNYLQWDGAKLLVQAANFTLDASGNITATAGAIGGWTIAATRLYATNISLYSGVANTARLEVGASTYMAGVNSPNASGDIAFWAGNTHANRTAAPFRVTAGGALTATNATITGAITATSGSFTGTITAAAGSIGGWTIASDRLYSTGVNIYSGASARIELGNLILHGSGYIRGNYTAGVAGWNISDTGNAEFNNVTVRGAIRSSIFEYNEISATAGTFMVAYRAGKVHAQFNTPTAIDGTRTGVQISDNADGGTMLANNDYVQLRWVYNGAPYSAWCILSAKASFAGYSTFTFTLKSGSLNAVVPAGTAVIVYNNNGTTTGVITLSTDGANGLPTPTLDMSLASTTPWNGMTSVVRVGNLNGWGAIASDQYGFAAGQATGDHIVWSGSALTVRGMIVAMSSVGGGFEDFFSFTTDQIDNHYYRAAGTQAEWSIETGGVAGGTVLRVGNNSGDDDAWIYGNYSIPFDPNKLYRVFARVRMTAGTTGRVYIGVGGRDATDTLYVNRDGNNYSTTNQYYFAAFGVLLALNTWTECTGYFKGTAAVGDNGQHPYASDPGTVHDNVRYIRPMFLMNWSNVAGIMEIDEFRIDIVPDGTEITNIDGGSITTGYISADRIEARSLDATVLSLQSSLSIHSSVYGTTGIQLDYNGGTPRAYIGNSTTGRYFLFDGTNIGWIGNNTSLTTAGVFTASNAIITGAITATSGSFTGTLTSAAGTIAGWTLAAGLISATNIKLYSGAANTARLEVGTSTYIAGVNSPNATGDIAFWAGNTHANRTSAAFRVTAGGALTATNATLSGSLSANSGNITINDSGINIAAGTSYLDDRSIVWNYSGRQLLKLSSYGGAADYSQLAHGSTSSTRNNYLDLYSSSAQNYAAQLGLYARSGAFDTTYIVISADYDGPNTITMYAFDGISVDTPLLSATGDIRAADGIAAGTVAVNPGAGDVLFTGQLVSYKGSVQYNVYGMVPPPLRIPFTNASFNGNARSSGSGTIQLQLFSDGTNSIPSGVEIKFALVELTIRDSAIGTSDLGFTVGPHTDYRYCVNAKTRGGDILEGATGWCPVYYSGGIPYLYYSCTASGTNTMDVWVRIWGYSL